MYTYIISQFFGKSRTGLNVMLKLPKNTYLFFLQARDSVPAGPKTVLVPLQSNFKYICIYMFVRTWKIIMPFIHVVLEECTP